MYEYIHHFYSSNKVKNSDQIGAAHAHKYTDQPTYCRDLISEIDKDIYRKYQYLYINMQIYRHERYNVEEPTAADIMIQRGITDNMSFADTIKKRPMVDGDDSSSKELKCDGKLSDDATVISNKAQRTTNDDDSSSHSNSPVKFY